MNNLKQMEMINPYWAEWERLTGGGPSYEYCIWISQKHVEFRKATNTRGHEPDYVRNFTAWLREVTEHDDP